MNRVAHTIDGHGVRLKRVLNVGAARLFDCFTDPALIAQWWGPNGVNCPAAENDLSVGGRFRFAMRSGDGTTDTAACGEYLVIDPPGRLVFSWFWEGTPQQVSRVTLTFTEIKKHRTEIELVHDRFDTVERAALHEQGWSSSLECLADAVDSD